MIKTWQTIGYGNISVVLVKIIGVNEWLSRRKLKKSCFIVSKCRL